MIIILICLTAILAYWFWKCEAIEADEEKIVSEKAETDLFELLKNQNDLNNAAFAARKALIQEALDHSQAHSYNNLHDGM